MSVEYVPIFHMVDLERIWSLHTQTELKFDELQFALFENSKAQFEKLYFSKDEIKEEQNIFEYYESYKDKYYQQIKIIMMEILNKLLPSEEYCIVELI